MLGIILFYLPSLLCGIHVVRTGREMYWLWLFVIGPLIAPAFYVLANAFDALPDGLTATWHSAIPDAGGLGSG